MSVSDGSLLPAVDVMRDELGTSYGLKLAEGTNCPITFTLDENLDVTGHVGSAQSITADEAYTIVSDADSVTVKARSATAGIWAAQTLLQLIGPWTNSTGRQHRRRPALPVARRAGRPGAFLLPAR